MFFAGCKIKALRAKTNTYIKTPLRGEDPIFIITGRPEDVSSARREILSAADHFTQIRAKRSPVFNTAERLSSEFTPDGHKISIMVKVPYRVVGLVVGPKGATVKRIQQLTNTYIVTPSRDKDPAFEVRGLPENVEKAKIEIESYIALRTGGGADSPDSSIESDYFDTDSLSSYGNNNFFERTPKTPDSAFSNNFALSPMANAVFCANQEVRDQVPRSAPVMPSHSEQVFNFTAFSESLYAALPKPMPIRVHQPTSDVYPIEKGHPPSPTYSCDSGSSDGFSTNSPKRRSPPCSSALCCVCTEEPASAALIPCGHNLYCWSCATYIAEYVHRCPVCSSQVNNLLRIHSR